MIKLQKFVFNPFQENTYLIWDDVTKESIIIDPGCSTSEEEIKLSHFIETEKLNIKYLINTHCHIDHVLGNYYVKEQYNCDYYAPELDLPLLDNLLEQAKMFGVNTNKFPKPDEYLSEELVLNIGNLKMEFIFTPGHSPGEYCVLFKKEKICITGDVLFLEGIGRTDLWGGNYNTLIESIESKLFTLEEDIEIYPGHGDVSTIGYEKKNNPFLK